MSAQRLVKPSVSRSRGPLPGQVKLQRLELKEPFRASYRDSRTACRLGHLPSYRLDRLLAYHHVS